MKDKMKIITIFFILVLSILSGFLNYYVNIDRFPNTDTNQNDIFSNALINTQSLHYTNSLNEKYGESIFGVRGLLNFGKDYFVPSAIPGIIIILTIFKLISNNFTFFINPFFVFIGLIYFFKFCNEFIFDKTSHSLTAIFLYFFSGPFLYVSSTPFKDAPATAFFFVGLYYLFRAIENKKYSDFVLFGFFCGVLIWLNYPMALFYAPLVGWYIYRAKTIKTEKVFLHCIIIIVPLVLVLYPLYNAQVSLFGGFLRFNSFDFRLNHFELEYGNLSILEFIRSVDIKLFFVNFYKQIFKVHPVGVLIATMFSIFSLCFKKDSERPLIILLLSLILIQFLFYLGKSWSGDIFVGSAGTTYSRYLLSAWGMIIILSVKGLYEFIDSKKILFFIILLIMTLSIFLALFSDTAIVYFVNSAKWSEDLRNEIANTTSPDSIFFTSYYDKYIFPIRETAVYVSFPPDERAIRTINLVKKILLNGKEVYFFYTKEESEDFLNDNKDLFLDNGLIIEQHYKTIYRVRLANESSPLIDN